MTQNRAPICDTCGSKLIFYRKEKKAENGRYVIVWSFYCAECQKFTKIKI